MSDDPIPNEWAERTRITWERIQEIDMVLEYDEDLTEAQRVVLQHTRRYLFVHLAWLRQQGS